LFTLRERIFLMSFRTVLTGTVIAVSLMLWPAAAQYAAPTSNVPATGATLSSQDFISKAAVSDLYEIRAAKIAQRRSHNPDIGRFAARMIRDHSQSSMELRDIVRHVGAFALPAVPDAQHSGMLRELRGVSDRQFNWTYARQQVQAHEDAVALFSAYQQTGNNLRLRRFVSKVLPVIRHHLEMARDLSVERRTARGR
jgi:putative membrane protein